MNQVKENIPTPEEFAYLMKALSGEGDLETIHSEMDDLMAKLLRKLGYGEAMDVFEEQDKWYA